MYRRKNLTWRRTRVAVINIDTDMSALPVSHRLHYLDALVPRERLALHISCRFVFFADCRRSCAFWRSAACASARPRWRRWPGVRGVELPLGTSA